MKYFVVLGDGMSDFPVAELGGRTPLQAAKKPNMDYLARHGAAGLAQTIPEGVSTGSDTANMSVMGFDPLKYYTGRAPIEAVSMGVPLGDEDVAYRCNLVSLSEADAYNDRTMVDYSSDEISSEEASELIADVNGRLSGELSKGIRFYPGISYRHCMVWHNRGRGASCTPPHDILTRRIGDYLPADADGSGDAAVLNELMRESCGYLSAHPVNAARARRGLLPANSLWLWGQGGRLALSSFKEKFRVAGAVISAVDLIKGIGMSAGLGVIDVEGATGTLHTNYEGKARAALRAADEGYDFVYIHVEAPDECGHRNEIENKVRAIEYIDEKIVAVLLDGLKRRGEAYKILLLPDHATPLSLRTHTRDPVPFVIYSSEEHRAEPACAGYDEAEAAKTGLFVDPGHTLLELLIKT